MKQRADETLEESPPSWTLVIGCIIALIWSIMVMNPGLLSQSTTTSDAATGAQAAP